MADSSSTSYSDTDTEDSLRKRQRTGDVVHVSELVGDAPAPESSHGSTDAQPTSVTQGLTSAAHWRVRSASYWRQSVSLLLMQAACPGVQDWTARKSGTEWKDAFYTFCSEDDKARLAAVCRRQSNHSARVPMTLSDVRLAAHDLRSKLTPKRPGPTSISVRPIVRKPLPPCWRRRSWQ